MASWGPRMVRVEMADQMRKSLQRPFTSTMTTAMGRPSRAVKGQLRKVERAVTKVAG